MTTTKQLSVDDAHSRVAVLFAMAPLPDEDTPTLVAVSVKWIVAHGPPLDPNTNIPMAYHGTFTIQ